MIHNDYQTYEQIDIEVRTKLQIGAFPNSAGAAYKALGRERLYTPIYGRYISQHHIIIKSNNRCPINQQVYQPSISAAANTCRFVERNDQQPAFEVAPFVKIYSFTLNTPRPLGPRDHSDPF